MKKDFTNSYLVFASDLRFFESTARKYKADALKLKDNKYNDCTPTFHLLSSLAFELFPKILIGYEICLKYNNDNTISEEEIRKEITHEMRSSVHNLSKLYNSFPDLKKYLNITDIVEFKNDYVWEYRIKLNNNKDILIKDVDAIRYGSFAKSRDIMTLCIYDEEIVNLLEQLENYIEAKNKEMNEMLKKS